MGDDDDNDDDETDEMINSSVEDGTDEALEIQAALAELSNLCACYAAAF